MNEIKGCSMTTLLEVFGVARSAMVSVVSAIMGTIFGQYIISTDVALQRLAWTVAILAGVVSIINGIRSIIRKGK